MITDFHSHILPGIDDGSASVEQSIAMLSMEAAQGIDHVVATPHFYPQQDSPGAFLERRNRAEDLLRCEMCKYPNLPELSVGAEVYFFSGISGAEDLNLLTIDFGRYMLLEMPQPPWTNSMYQEVEKIVKRQDITPIMAHIDRYIRPYQTYHIPEKLSNLPVLVQANASFFLRKSTRRMAMRMLKQGQIHLLGSDCHNLDTRPPNLGDASREIMRELSYDVLRKIECCQKQMGL